MLTIDSFTGDYRFLSNFAPAPMLIDGLMYPTLEHAFQAMKSDDYEYRLKVSEAPTPAQAKKLGRSAKLRPNWDAVKVGVMRNLLKVKFAPGSEYAKQLLDTDDIPLIEGNWWNDRFWGVCNGIGENHLGKLLMEIRAELKEGTC